MTAAGILKELAQAGIEVRLKGGTHLAVPPGKLTPDQRALLLSHRYEVIEFLNDADNTSAALIEAAMRACDHHGDNPVARSQMVREVEAIPPRLRQDLLDHFDGAYP